MPAPSPAFRTPPFFTAAPHAAPLPTSACAVSLTAAATAAIAFMADGCKHGCKNGPRAGLLTLLMVPLMSSLQEWSCCQWEPGGVLDHSFLLLSQKELHSTFTHNHAPYKMNMHFQFAQSPAGPKGNSLLVKPRAA
eukprot:456345-Pelagomonas_calceolata.AAC.6